MTAGLGMLEAGDFGSAIAALREACSLDPDAAFSWFNLGLAHKRARQFAEAQAAFLSAYAYRTPGTADEMLAAMLWNIGISSSAIGAWTQAAAAWRRLGHKVGKRPDGSPSIPMGVAFVQVGSRAPAFGQRIDPARIEIGDDRPRETALRQGVVVVHDATRVGEVEHTGMIVPIFPMIAAP